MAVILPVKNLEDFTSSVNEKGMPSYTLSFQVMTDDLFTGPNVAMTWLPVSIGDPYVFGDIPDYRAVCIGANQTKVERNSLGGYIYTFTVQYGQLENSQIPSSPLTSPAEQSFSVESVEEVCDFEIDGTPILNSAGMPYDPPVTKRVAKGRFTIVQNEAAFNFGLLSYSNTVNSDTFLGFPAGWVYCLGFGFQGPNFQDDVSYFKITYEFFVDSNGHQAKVLDRGKQEVVDGKLQNIKFKGDPVTDGVPLNGVGRALPVGSPAVERNHNRYTALPYSGAFSFRF